MSAKPKKRLPMLQARMPARLRAEFYVVADMKDISATKLATQLVRKYVRKYVRKHHNDDPQKFEQAVQSKLTELSTPKKTAMKLVPGARQKAASSKS